MIDDKILFCIFNYRRDENAKFWKQELSKYFDVVVLDSGNDHIEPEFVQFPNIYYSGLFNQMKNYSSKKEYEYIGLICSDIQIDNTNLEKFIKTVKDLRNHPEIGMYQPGVTDDSRHSWTYSNEMVEDNKKFSVNYIDGYMYVAKKELLDLVDFVELEQNLYGYGIDLYLSEKSLEKGCINVVDTSIRVYHPNDKGYNDEIANKQGAQYLTKLKGHDLLYCVNKYNVNLMNTVKDDFNIVWYVLCWNEMPILPFMIDYWKQIARKVIIFDDNSTDGTLEYLSTFDWIEVRPFPIKTDNTLNDEINFKIKNECWKEQRGKGVDFVIVSDLDEVLWSRNLYEEFNYYKQKNIAVVKPQAYDFVSLHFPIHGNQLLHDQIKTCYRFEWYDKCILFSPDIVDEINYTEGAHSCSPQYDSSKYTDWNSGSLYMFHFKYLGLEYLLMKRYAIKNRLSQTNIDNKWSGEYQFTREQTIEQFYERWTWAKNYSVDNLLS